MTDFDSELSIKVKGKELIVPLAGSNYAVTYSATALPDYSIVNTDDPRPSSNDSGSVSRQSLEARQREGRELGG